MAEVPQGPGQQESIGFGKSRRAPEKPGLYYHWGVKQYSHVGHHAAADALVRLGFVLITPGQKLTKEMDAQMKSGKPPARPKSEESEEQEVEESEDDTEDENGEDLGDDDDDKKAKK